ncbi:MAG: hypothetical protein R3E39_14040 [Anaerolineae bacterium]
MMVEVIVEFEVDDRPTTPAEVEDEYLAEMLEHTGEQIRRDVERKVGDMRCAEHDKSPRVTVTGTYDTAAEQMELSYHVDSCCQMMLLLTVQALNH